MNKATYWVVLLICIATRTAQAQETIHDTRPTDIVSSSVEIDQMFGNIESHGISGAVCTVVQDNRVIHSKGYGTENRTTGQPIDPNTTRFYLASVTKALTATMIIRLVDRGELNLDEDIRNYLGDKPPLSVLPGSSPITLRHLLTHTAGFDDRNIGMAAANRHDLVSLSEYLSRALPAQIRRAGEITMYDNHGWALAGLVAERVTNTPYHELLQRELFGPLGMQNSFTINSVSEVETVDLAEAYVTRYENDEIVWKKVKRSYRQTSPAGSVWSTAEDMTRFIQMHLNRGQLAGIQFVSDDASMQMQINSWESQPKADGLTAGFWERRISGNRVLMIMGDAPEGASIIALVPQKNLGIFLAVSRKDMRFLTPILKQILAIYAPGPQPELAGTSLSNWIERSSNIAGEYYLLRFSQQSLETLAKWQAWVRVELLEAGRIRVTDSLGDERVYQETSPNVYRQDGKPGFISFKSSPNGKAIWATTTDGLGSGDGMGFPNSFQKAKWFERVKVKLCVLFGNLVVFSLAIFAWPLVKLFVNVLRYCKRSSATAQVEVQATKPRWGRFLVWLMATTGLAGMLGVAMLFADQDQLVIGMPAWGQIPCWLLLIYVCLSLVCIRQTIVAWKRKAWSLAERLFVSTVVTTTVVLIPFLWQWNLIQLSF